MTATALGLPAIRPATGGPHGVVAEPEMPTSGPLCDVHGRTATDLRVSVTDRCNLRCRYCMPAEGLDWLPDGELLTPAEMQRLLALAVERLGIRSVRFTGGEPLLYRPLAAVVAATAALRPRPEIALTTNGVSLARHADALAAAGLDRVNVSLDSVDAARFAAQTRRDRLADVLVGLAAARDAGLAPIKINAVLDPRTGLADARALLSFSLDHGYRLRFIEQMPLDAGRTWDRATALTAEQIRDALAEDVTLTPVAAPRGSSPAQLWRVDGTDATVGIIASVTEPFCGACDRVRLTADGQVRSCLFATRETDLRGLLRGGADDDTLERAWRVAMWRKPAGHGIDDPAFSPPARPMSAIGG